MIKNKILQLTLISSGLINLAFAEGVQYATVEIKFNTYNNKLLAQQYTIGDYGMSCAGLNDAYYLYSSSMGTNKNIALRFAGPFNGDQRDTCKIFNNYKQLDQQVYFIVGNLPISFNYNNNGHTCNIQQFGTTYGGVSNYSALVSEFPKMPIQCSTESGSLDTYTIENSTITINVPK